MTGLQPFREKNRTNNRIIPPIIKTTADATQLKQLQAYERAVTLLIPEAKGKGVFTCKNSPRCEFETGMTLRFHTVFTWMDTSFRPTWLWRPGDAILGLDIEDCACASRSRLPGEWFHARANSRTAFTCMSFRTGMKISPRHSYRGELAPVWLAPVQDFMLVSYKRIQSHKREVERTRTGMKVAPVSCKHLPSRLAKYAITMTKTLELIQFPNIYISPKQSKQVSTLSKRYVWTARDMNKWSFLSQKLSFYLIEVKDFLLRCAGRFLRQRLLSRESLQLQIMVLLCEWNVTIQRKAPSWAVLSCGVVYYAVQGGSNFWVCGWNLKV